MSIFGSFMPGESSGMPTQGTGGLLGGGKMDLGLLGLSLLANNNSKNFGQNLGRAGISAIGMQQRMQQQQAMNDWRKSQQEMMQERLGIMRDRHSMEKKAYTDELTTKAQQSEILKGITEKYGIDPNIISAFPDIGKDLVKNKVIPKTPKIAFTPNNVAYDANNPNSIELGKSYSAIDYNKPFLPDGTPNKAYQDFAQSKARAGASSVSVNTGQKGFENTLKLRSGFKQEPIYKAHQDAKAAHSQVMAGLKQGTPIGDVAAATKIMKLLDPGSVVRESELGIAMAASGLMDRLTNYAQMTINGTKLTPEQRQEFAQLAEGLYSESVNQFNAKRSEYKGVVERNGLNELDALGRPEEFTPTSTTQPDAQPMPEKPSKMTLKRGVVYDTPKGALRWNGQTFEDL